MLNEKDKEFFTKISEEISNSLDHIGNSIPSDGAIDYAIQICEHGEHIERGLWGIAKALEHIAEAIENK